MTQEERLLLLQDLCSRLPYGVKVDVASNWTVDSKPRSLVGLLEELVSAGYDINDFDDYALEDVKPYLRPMDSMTEEEKTYQMKLIRDIKHGANIDKLEDFYHSHYFDYRGLIPIGLALPAKDGMYNMSQPN